MVDGVPGDAHALDDDPGGSRSGSGSTDASGDGFVWVELVDPTAEQVRAWADRLALHPLAVDVAVEHRRRARLTHVGDTLVVSLPRLRWDTGTDVTAERMSEVGRAVVLLAPHAVITVVHGHATAVGAAADELTDDPERLAAGPWSVFHAVTDTALDEWLDLAHDLADRLDQLEADTFSGRSADPSQLAYRLKRDLIEFKRQVTGLSVPLHRVAAGDHGPVTGPLTPQARELAAHHQLLTDSLQASDEVLGSIVQAAFARISVQQNEDMRRISAWVAIVAVPTFLAGVWGMNFQHMPELALPWGYFAALGLMLAIMVGLWITFKHHRWL